ncbi:hypothetical protein BDZ97DRAFT_622530 [Flammula alnicola]|nr:hypothetical protein BDZ97DRAFT_622530 [Flammula alnicola]
MEIIKTIARLIRNCLYPPHPSDAAYEKAKEAYKKFQQSKSHLEKAIVSYEEAVEQRRPDHQELATTLVNLATATWNSYELSNRPEDKLDKVIALQEEALSLWKERNPKPEGYPVLLTNLGNAYMERYWKCEAKSAIENAIRIFQEAHDITPTDAKTHIMAAMRLGMAISTYCDHESQTDNRIDSAIEYLTKAYTLCAQHSYKSIMADCTYNLAGAHRTRFNLNQELRPGDRSSTINFYKITLQLIPPTILTALHLSATFLGPSSLDTRRKAGSRIWLMPNTTLHRRWAPSTPTTWTFSKRSSTSTPRPREEVVVQGVQEALLWMLDIPVPSGPGELDSPTLPPTSPMLSTSLRNHLRASPRRRRRRGCPWIHRWLGEDVLA